MMQKYNTKGSWRILHRLLGMAAVTLAAMLFLVMGLYVDTGAAAKKSLKKTVLSSVKSTDSGAVSVKYKKTSGAKGYQIQYTADKNFKKGVKSKTTAKTTYPLSGLTPGTKYYVRVRAYAKKGGGKAYGPWSSKKAVTVKPAKAAVSSAAYAGGKVTVKVKAVKKAKGYQYQLGKDKAFKSLAASKKTTGRSYSQAIDSSLGSCYVRVRAYVAKSGKTTYGPWSAVKEIKLTQGMGGGSQNPGGGSAGSGGSYSIQGSSNVEVYTGGEVELRIAANGSANRNPRTKWKVADTGIASIVFDYGLGASISGIKAGTTTVTATIGEQTLSWKVKVVQPVSRYSYDIQILNNPAYHLYSGNVGQNYVIYYVKTNNPDVSSIKRSGSDCSSTIMHFSDIHYISDKISTGFTAVRGGFLYVAIYANPGEKDFIVQEKLSDGKYYDVARYTVSVLDGEETLREWLKDTLTSRTNSSTSKIEKIFALKDYIKEEFKYFANDGNGTQVLLTDHMGAYWENKEITCSSATYMMGEFANLLGLDWRTENTGTHSANVIIDESGEEHYIDAQPPASSNVITNWDYKN